MKYILICHDGKDAAAPQRRFAAREQHLKRIQKNSHFVFGSAILKNNQMVGSVMVMDFANDQALEKYLQNEIYVTSGVWQEIERFTCAPGFFGPAAESPKKKRAA